MHIRSGDAVLVRTGRWALREAKGPWDIANASAGLAPSAMVWLHQRDAAFLVSDCAHDALPAPVEGVDFPIHVLAIVAMGMPLADQCNLEDVGREAQKLNAADIPADACPRADQGWNRLAGESDRNVLNFSRQGAATTLDKVNP